MNEAVFNSFEQLRRAAKGRNGTVFSINNPRKWFASALNKAGVKKFR